MIFDVESNILSQAYNRSGEVLAQAYNLDGDDANGSDAIVMTFNIQKWGGLNSNTEIMNDIFGTYHPLVCGVQETGNGTLKYIGTQFERGIAMTSVPNNPGLLFNTTYEDYTDTVYSINSGENRGYQKCYVTIGDKRVAIYNTHLTVSASSARISQMAQLLADMQTEPRFIALGDFNCMSTTFTDAEYVGLANPPINAGYNLCNWTEDTGLVQTYFSGTTIADSTTTHPCDNIITSANIKINRIVYDMKKVEADAGQTLDHIPIVAYLTVH